MKEDYKCKNCGFVFRVMNYGQFNLYTQINCPKCNSNAVDKIGL